MLHFINVIKSMIMNTKYISILGKSVEMFKFVITSIVISINELLRKISLRRTLKFLLHVLIIM